MDTLICSNILVIMEQWLHFKEFIQVPGIINTFGCNLQYIYVLHSTSIISKAATFYGRKQQKLVCVFLSILHGWKCWAVTAFSLPRCPQRPHPPQAMLVFSMILQVANSLGSRRSDQSNLAWLEPGCSTWLAILNSLRDHSKVQWAALR